MTRATSLVVAVLVVVGCRPDLAEVGDDEAQTTTNASDSSDEQTAESSFLEAESESAESESESTDDTESADTTTEGSPECGNGQIDEREQCDGDDLDGYGCPDLGYFGGTIVCNPITCVFDVAGCYGAADACGNGVIDAVLDETCDTDDLAGQSCEGLGFVAGTLGCTRPCIGDGMLPCSYECQFDVSGCLVADEASRTCAAMARSMKASSAMATTCPSPARTSATTVAPWPAIRGSASSTRPAAVTWAVLAATRRSMAWARCATATTSAGSRA